MATSDESFPSDSVKIYGSFKWTNDVKVEIVNLDNVNDFFNDFRSWSKVYAHLKELDIGLMVRVFSNDPGDWGSIPGRVISKTQKMIIDISLLNTQHYKVESKWNNPGKGVTPPHTPWYRSYWKGSLRIALAYGRQLFLDITG